MTNQVSLENILKRVLSGDALKNVQDFVLFLQDNGFQMEYNPNEYTENKWTGAIGGTIGNSIGYMYINPGSSFPDPWTIWLNEYDFIDDDSAEAKELKDFLWENVNICSRCHEGWEKCGGGEKTVMGKKFESLCHSPMVFYAPDAQKLLMLEKLLLRINTDKC